MDDLSGFDSSTQRYAWAAAPPSEMVRSSIEDVVDNVHPGARVDRIICSEQPRYLSGAKEQDDDPDHLILVRVDAVSHTRISFTASDGIQQDVRGVSPMICQNLHAPGHQTIWLELTPHGDIDELEKLLPGTLYRDNYREQENGEGR